MTLLNDMLKKLSEAWTGSAFAKGDSKQNNGTTTYTFSDRGKGNGGSGKGRLQPIPVKAR